MSDVSFNLWFGEVLNDVPGVPQNVAFNAIRNAAIEFCEKSWVYRVTLDPIDIVADTAEYALSPGAGLKPAKVIRAWHDDVEIFPQTTQELSLRYAQWTTEEGTPQWFTQRKPESVILVPIPTAALTDGLDIELAIKPARSSTGILDEIYEKYLEEIAYGAKFKLFAMKSKPWSDATLAAGWRAAFDEACGTARVTAAKGFTRARQRVKAHFL